jgi:ethanolamine utilization protein EutP (predicted NTPase)
MAKPADAVIVLTKADLVPAGERDERVESLQHRVPGHVDVLAVNARSSDAARALAPYLGAGQTLVLLGSSGAGKSTLTNTLLGAEVQSTGAVREDDSRGRHTTRARSGSRAERASSTRRDCAGCGRISAKKTWQLRSATSRRWPNDVVSATAATAMSPDARCAPTLLPIAWSIIRKCCARSAARQ